MLWRWRKSHVFEEIFKLVPSLTNLNAFASIIFPAVFVLLVVASSAHTEPRIMDFSSGQSMSSVVAPSILSETATAFGVTASQMAFVNNGGVSTIAQAFKVGFVDPFNDSKFVKLATNHDFPPALNILLSGENVNRDGTYGLHVERGLGR